MTRGDADFLRSDSKTSVRIQGPKTLVSKVARRSSSRSMGWMIRTAALFTSTSTLPYVFSTSFFAAKMDFLLVTSRWRIEMVLFSELP